MVISVCGTSELLHYEGSNHIETSLLLCCANKWADFYLIWTSVMKYLREQIVFETKNFAGTPLSGKLKLSNW